MFQQKKTLNSIGGFTVDSSIILGQGGFGTVYLAKKDGIQYACKQINLGGGTNFNSVIRELSVMGMLKHPNLVRLVDHHTIGTKIYLFMEYCNGGNLYQQINRQQSKNEREVMALNLIQSMMKGLGQLYTQNTIHRDIKPQNILVHDGQYKLSDFGLSKMVCDVDTQRMTTYWGTPLYSSPQVLQGYPYTSKTDVWSFGVTLYEVVFGHHPFPCKNEFELIREIKFGRRKIQQSINSLTQPLIKSLLEKTIVENEEERISLKDLIEYGQEQQNYLYKSKKLEKIQLKSREKVMEYLVQSIYLLKTSKIRLIDMLIIIMILFILNRFQVKSPLHT